MNAVLVRINQLMLNLNVSIVLLGVILKFVVSLNVPLVIPVRIRMLRAERFVTNVRLVSLLQVRVPSNVNRVTQVLLPIKMDNKFVVPVLSVDIRILPVHLNVLLVLREPFNPKPNNRHVSFVKLDPSMEVKRLLAVVCVERVHILHRMVQLNVSHVKQENRLQPMELLHVLYVNRVLTNRLLVNRLVLHVPLVLIRMNHHRPFVNLVMLVRHNRNKDKRHVHNVRSVPSCLKRDKNNVHLVRLVLLPMSMDLEFVTTVVWDNRKVVLDRRVVTIVLLYLFLHPWFIDLLFLSRWFLHSHQWFQFV